MKLFETCNNQLINERREYFNFLLPSEIFGRKETGLWNGVEEIHSVGTINNVETSYFTQLKPCH